jgi:hypothetical protein
VQPKGRNGCDLHIVSEYGTRDLDGIEIDDGSFAAMLDAIARVQRPHCTERQQLVEIRRVFARDCADVGACATDETRLRRVNRALRKPLQLQAQLIVHPAKFIFSLCCCLSRF